MSEKYRTAIGYDHDKVLGEYDVIVVGAGHAGCEAALASARMGLKTLVLCITLESVAMMPCNPSIGGTGKGQLVREIDALGGEMGINIDKTMIQAKMLNFSKGPAVHSPRAQADKDAYHIAMKEVLEKQENLHLRQGEVIDILVSPGMDGDIDATVDTGDTVDSAYVTEITDSVGTIERVKDKQDATGDTVDSAYATGITDSVGTAEKTKDKQDAPFELEASGIKSNISKIIGVRIKTGTVYLSQTVVLATGTYLNALVHVSDVEYHSGPNGLSASMQLPQSLIDSGVGLRRFKTGTPARVLASTLDYSVTQPQKGDDAITPFSFLNDSIDIDQIDCYLTYTTPATHQIIADNIHKSAPYGGYTTGTGPRYCLSIEDKVDRFPDRLRHQVFLEPEGRYTDEVYVQGMSTSTPEDVQEQFYRTIIGMENAKFTRYGYSIEYDCIDPTVLSASLEHKKVSGLFFAGQICGSSGYEEAAAQGLMAGINAALKVKQMSPCILDRSDAYIGVLIDDLVTKGTNEPYRMMTSRAEYRLILRQDNADLRLTEIGRSIGLVDDTRYARFEAYQLELQAAFEYIKTHHIDGDTIRESFADILEGKIEGRRSIYELLRIPQINISDLIDKDDRLASMSARVLEQIGIQIKYEGYIHKQEDAIAKFKKLEHKLLPIDIDYLSLDGLRNEAKQKLDAIRPDSIGRASRISGVSPADINVLLVHLARLRHQEK